MSISSYEALFNALVRLMRPLVEIVVHDLQSQAICYIEGGLSKRAVGDPSLLQADDLATELDKIVYPKLNFDGRLVKSISVPFEQRWLICINCDVSVFNHMQNLSQQFLALDQRVVPESLFVNDWQERIHLAIHGFLDHKAWGFDNLSHSQKKEIVQHLYALGAFNEKNAAEYVAKILSIGRATVFNYLKQWRKK
jgi:predicted transcriptional regulator YheO